MAFEDSSNFLLVLFVVDDVLVNVVAVVLFVVADVIVYLRSANIYLRLLNYYYTIEFVLVGSKPTRLEVVLCCGGVLV